MPFAGHARGVILLFKDLRQGRLVGIQAVFHCRIERVEDPDAVVVATGEQRCARRGANGLGDMEIGEAPALAGKPVQIGSGIAGATKRTDVGIA